jgi:FKBP-type peptidyl-prolyl cis-trans isomerase FkpA
MKKLLLCIPIMGLLFASSCTDNANSESASNEEVSESQEGSINAQLQDSMSYALGVLMTKDLGKPTFDTIYPVEFIQAMEDYFNNTSKIDMNAAGQQLQAASTAGSVDPSQLNELSYAFGTYMANYAVGAQDAEDIKSDVLIKSLKDALLEGNSDYTQEQSMAVFERYMAVKQEIMAKEAAAAGDVNRAAGEKFLAQNAKRDGVQVTESGLQYEVLVAGTGAKPSAPTTRVKVHYEGTLINGEVFDSSIERGQPAEFGLNQVIKGWTEGVMLMEQGSKYKFYIPGDLAYGANPRPGGPIGPNETLIFEVELLEILD